MHGYSDFDKYIKYYIKNVKLAFLISLWLRFCIDNCEDVKFLFRMQYGNKNYKQINLKYKKITREEVVLNLNN